MTVSILKHIHFENPGYFLDIFKKLNIPVRIVELYNGDDPSAGNPDVIVLMGGPMNIYEEDKYPFFRDEKKFIKEAIRSGKLVIGVCLGAQLIADALGAKVYPNKSQEIGWFPVKKTTQGLMDFLPDYATVLHWHGDTFDLPHGAKCFYSSDYTDNQAFIYKNNVLAMQFHLEMTTEIIRSLSEEEENLLESKSVMSVDQIVANYSLYSWSNQKMLSNLVKYLLDVNNLSQ